MTQPTLLPSSNPRIPSATQPFRHCLPVQIRFTDVDMLGHLNNNIYFAFMDLAKIDYFKTIFGKLPDMRSIDMVVVHIDIDFYKPTFFGQRVEVWSTVTAIGNKSFHMEQRIVDCDTKETHCRATVVVSGFDPATNKSLPIADSWRQAISSFEHRTF